ncbi:hypothetical protein KSP39_PZI009996 [Platanthera zijinensis]|uniref:Uncharacterized protein n=1 Tax=Platanthera zijinensis TaxID=2320716 RepID=A0AAP0G639_9ASPA
MEAIPLYLRFPSPISGKGIHPAHLIAVASALRLGQFVRLRCANHLQLFLRSSSSHDYYHSVNLHKIQESWCWGPCTFKHYHLVKALYDTFSSSCSSCLSFFSGNEHGDRYVAKHKFQLKPSTGSPLKKRLWTNIFLALNIL